MKKFICIAAVLLTASVVQAADVDFYASGMSGDIAINYKVNGAENPRGIALKCTVLNGDLITIPDASITVHDPCFNTMIDFAYTVVDGGGTYNIGEGHPIADPCDPGVPVVLADINQFSICMGVLDQTGNQKAGPSVTGPLGFGKDRPNFAVHLVSVPIEFDTGGDPCATVQVLIEEDNLRGGVVGSQLTTNLPLTISVGRPTCWSYSRCPGQHRGDATCDGGINILDLNALKFSWLKKFGDPPTKQPPKPDIDYKCGANFDQTANGVNVIDLNIIKQTQNWLASGLGGQGLNKVCPWEPNFPPHPWPL
jgi:hypothetical protein